MSSLEAGDQVLCLGWIDGELHRMDDEFIGTASSPSGPGNNWSRVNVEKVVRLESEGLMMPAGSRASEAREEAKTGVESSAAGEDIPPLRRRQ